MKCDKCKINEAEYRVYETDNGKTETFNLCTECNRQYEIGNLNKNASLETKYKHCPVCKTTFESFAKDSKFGCPYCYVFFDDFTKTFFNYYTYQGNKPISYDRFRQNDQLTKIKEELGIAIENNDKSRIQELTQQIKELLKR